ncbi:MAG: hypothetical protein AABY88_08440 [Pseudomonadota bacterium]
MIAQRFRPVGWVAGIALAATALYLVSLQVASERGRLESIDRKIAATKREIRQLQTEMGTRASLRQLERWNGEVLALSAPQAGQYLSGEAALETLNRDEIGRKPSAPPAVMVAVRPVETKAVEAATPSTLFAALTTPKAPPKLTAQDYTVQAAIAPKQRSRPAREDIALVDRDGLARLAKGEVGVPQNKDRRQR